MPTIHVDTEQLLQAALQLPHTELEQFVTRLLALSIRQDTPHLTQAESELLLKINQGLPPAMQQKLDELIAKRQTQTLTAEEHEELIQLTEHIEKADAERLRDYGWYFVCQLKKNRRFDGSPLRTYRQQPSV